ncbi:AbrB/MazE/SpoVT family DNA-binding domain-containing protein [Candidatus Nanohalovita haloferacivicina]|nr:hypothetical protein HBNXNv_0342 [Candidatus Nanohalobia archaeon BNXNv]
MKVQEKPNGQFVLTIPKRLANAKNWEDGQEVEWKLNSNGKLELEED